MKKKSNSLVYLAIALILVVIVASLIANTLARYANEYTGSSTVTAAKWSFESGNLDTVIKLEDTAYETMNLAKGKLAPGTAGEFDILLDGKGSETGIKYTISLTKTGTVPAGFKIYPDDTSVDVTGDVITGYIPYSSTETMEKTLKIKWEWELGNDETTDGIDNIYSETTFNLGLKVRGEQHIGASE